MEKLQPVLNQKFWILLGVGIIMTITGWWMATGSMASTITARKGEVDKAFGRIPSGEIPNTDWSTQLAARNAEQDKAIRYTALGLWERQKSRMTWPESVAEYAWQNGYRGEIALSGRENYRIVYGLDVRRVWETVRPFNQLDGSGIVVYGQDQRILPQIVFGRQAPLSAEMWDAQEDLWLLESLLQAVVRVNGGPEGQRGDAYLHVIEKLELCGGVPAAQRKASSGAPAGGMGGNGPAGAHGGSGSAASMTFGGSGPGLEGRTGNTGAMASADFDRRDEFGEDGSSKTGAGAMGGMGGGMTGSAPASAHGGGSAAGGNAPMGSTGSTASAVRRYIDDDAALPYKTRGFYMSVIMDHRKIPSLIAELSASDTTVWPVEIVRVQMVRLHDDDVNSTNQNSGFGSSGTRSPMAGLSSFGTGSSSSFAPVADGEGFNRTFNNDPTSTTSAASTNPNAVQASAAGIAALESALQDPFMAKVALCGIITLYKEVKPDPVAAPASGTVTPPTTPTPPATATTNPAEAAKPEENPAAPEATTPATTDKPSAEDNGDAKPPADAKPQDPAAAAEANPPKAPPTPDPVPKEPSPNK